MIDRVAHGEVPDAPIPKWPCTWPYNAIDTYLLSALKILAMNTELQDGIQISMSLREALSERGWVRFKREGVREVYRVTRLGEKELERLVQACRDGADPGQ